MMMIWEEFPSIFSCKQPFCDYLIFFLFLSSFTSELESGNHSQNQNSKVTKVTVSDKVKESVNLQFS
jgi:hypothetical protein